MPNLIPDWLPWMRPAGRLILASILLLILVGITVALMKRPKPDRPATWAECIVGAVGVFAMMTLAYAVIPHEWITFSDKYLQWDTTKFVVQSGQEVLFFKFPFDITMKAISDIIAAGIYIVFFGAQPGPVRDVAEARAGDARERGSEAAHLALRPPACGAGPRSRSPSARRRRW